MRALTVQLRVTGIRSRGKHGGVIFSGVSDAYERYIAVCKSSVINDASLVDRGQRWVVSGSLVMWNDEQQIEVTIAQLVRPSGSNIVEWIANSTMCAGIGHVKASKLYDRFGPALIEHIDRRNLELLGEIVSLEAADLLCHAFETHRVAGTLLWLDRLGIHRRIGQKIADFYGEQAQAKLEENPYRLVSFAEKWKSVDQLAQRQFGVTQDDPRRLNAAAEEALYSGLSDGHTCLPSAGLRSRLHKLLGLHPLVTKALALDNDARYRRVGDFFQPAGTYVIEQYVATRLREIACGEATGQHSLLGNTEVDEAQVARSIAQYESENGLTLTAEQRVAVIASAASNLCLILGGAGTGKTTVLKALYRALEASQPCIAIHQLALAGRAAQRMTEATGRESMTIASFLNKVDSLPLGHGSVVVIDEMSMVDVILMYRLLLQIPPGTRIVLVGDPSQLPPIGPGLVLHSLVGNPWIVQTELKVTKRQSSASGIPSVAAAIRRHEPPQFARYVGKGSGVSFVPCSDAELDATVLQVYEELGGNGSDYAVQILSTTRSNVGGVRELNSALHARYRQEPEQIQCYAPQFGVVGALSPEKLPICVGDLVIFTENNYELGLRNGSLGIIVEALKVTDVETVCCRAQFEGIEYRFNSTQLQPLVHAYSITVHKSQGSQFERVIIPVRKSRLLDQALIYTAVTRGVQQVVLVGNLTAAQNAIAAPPSSSRRHVLLPALLESSRLSTPGDRDQLPCDAAHLILEDLGSYM